MTDVWVRVLVVHGRVAGAGGPLCDRRDWDQEVRLASEPCLPFSGASAGCSWAGR